MHGTTYPTGPLNPGATAFYPMVPGAICSQRLGVTSEPSPEPAPGLPHFGNFKPTPKELEEFLQMPMCLSTVCTIVLPQKDSRHHQGR